ncbi:MAG: hypothetical protein RL684_2364 [Pseudomonadota bacterium]|jgi:hypothetical protein
MSRPSDSARADALDAALARLPLEQAPARDLWPAIAQQLHAGSDGDGAAAPARTLRPMALAASVAALALLGALAWNLRAARLADPAGPATQASALQASAHYGPPDNAAYEAARVKLERTFEERLDLLAPATRERVRADLATIRAANADLRAALAQDPASPLLLQLLASTWRQEIELYASVARTTSPLIQRRTRT